MSASPSSAPSSAPVGVDPTRASIARVYDAALGGKDNYAIDRGVLEEISKVTPDIQIMAWANRNWLIRVARFLTDQCGIRQFIDCGSGLPTAENTHEVVQRIAPESTTVYVDNDPVVLAHGNALLADNDSTYIANADIYRPADVLGHDLVSKHIDFTEPVALMHVSTMHHYIDDDGDRIMQEYIDALPSGSYVALSHFYDPADPAAPEHSALARKMEDIFVHSAMGSGVFRTKEQIMALLPGLEIVPSGPNKEPELELCAYWWPDGPTLRPLTGVEYCIAGAVGRKP
jgi:SAM-dependent methyltransferase